MSSPLPPRRRPRGAGLLTALICGAQALSAPACSPPEGPVREGHRAPPYSGVLLEGGDFVLADYLGEPVLVNLWATWCLPCREEMPVLEEIHRTWGASGLRVVGVSVDGPGAAGEVRAFRDGLGVTFPVVHDPAQVALRLFGAPGLPATYLIDREGVVRWVRLGPVRATDPHLWTGIRDAVGRPSPRG